MAAGRWMGGPPLSGLGPGGTTTVGISSMSASGSPVCSTRVKAHSALPGAAAALR
jgi:hypothetical protein